MSVDTGLCTCNGYYNTVKSVPMHNKIVFILYSTEVYMHVQVYSLPAGGQG